MDRYVPTIKSLAFLCLASQLPKLMGVTCALVGDNYVLKPSTSGVNVIFNVISHKKWYNFTVSLSGLFSTLLLFCMGNSHGTILLYHIVT